MNSKEIISRVSSKADVTKTQAEKILKSLVEIFREGLAENGEVNISGLGRFVKSVRKGRVGISLQSKVKIEIPAKNVVKFKPTKIFKEFVENLKLDLAE